MNRGDWQRLLHIRTHCRDIRGFVEQFGKDQDVFTSDRACFNAVSMAILQIGELANGLSESFREMTKERIPWGMIREMRNWLAHAYGEMDEGVLWETATRDIPALLDFCEEALHYLGRREAIPAKRGERDN